MSTSKVRSRCLLPRLHEVSEVNGQAWQAAPCREPSLPGSCSAQSGSELHSPACSMAVRKSCSRRSGQPGRPGRRGCLLSPARPCTAGGRPCGHRWSPRRRAAPAARQRSAAFERELPHEHVYERAAQPRHVAVLAWRPPDWASGDPSQCARKWAELLMMLEPEPCKPAGQRHGVHIVVAVDSSLADSASVKWSQFGSRHGSRVPQPVQPQDG